MAFVHGLNVRCEKNRGVGDDYEFLKIFAVGQMECKIMYCNREDGQIIMPWGVMLRCM